MRRHRSSCENENIVSICLDEIHVPEKTVEKILRRDHAQINRMRHDFEVGKSYVRVVLRANIEGFYQVEDGRHRVIAAKQAGIGWIDAILV